MPITKLDAIKPYIKEYIMFIYIILKYIEYSKKCYDFYLGVGYET